MGFRHCSTSVIIFFFLIYCLLVQKIDDNKSLPLIFEQGKAKTLQITFQGKAVDKMQFNGMALCPAVVYLDKFGVPEAALCEGSTLHVMTGNKPPLRTGPDTVN